LENARVESSGEQMLESVDIGKRSVADYETTVGPGVVERLRTLAEPLSGARILHLNATPYGGGVAKILRSEVPLLGDSRLAADWKIITGDKGFFSVTKTMHNALHGAKRSLTDYEKEVYLRRCSSTPNALSCSCTSLEQRSFEMRLSRAWREPGCR
jgi:hypothetical protein